VARRVLRFCSLLLVAGSAVFHSEAQQPPTSSSQDSFQRGLIALQENSLEQALDAFTVAEQERPNDAQIHNFRGITLMSLGRADEAATEYSRAIGLDNGLQDAYRNLGFLEWTARQSDNARKHLERALKLAPGDSFAHYYLGRLELDDRHYQQAFQHLEQPGVTWPEDPAFLIEAATGYLKLGRLQDADRTLDKVSAIQHSDAQAVQLGSLYVEASKVEKALTVFQKFKEQASDWAQLDLAIAYLYAGQYQNADDLAQTLCQRTQAGHAELASAYSIIGVANAKLRREQQAIAAFQKAATLAPGQEEQWLNLTRELMESNRLNDAIIAAQEGLKSNPKSYALHLRLAAAYFSSGHYAEAENSFRELVAAGDPLPTSYVGLAQVLLRTGRAAEAAKELADAEKRLGPQFMIVYFRGLALNRAGDRPGAIAAFKQAVLLNPTSIEAHLGAGKTSLALGHATEAIEELQRVLQLDPGNMPARRLLSQAYARLGDRENAATYATPAIQTEADPQTSFIGDFLLPDWRQPAAQ
jgi:tetratricopeptide (TPR) repeat protein